jgi:hypothetical protein
MQRKFLYISAIALGLFLGCQGCSNQRFKPEKISISPADTDYRKVDFDSAIFSIDRNLDSNWTFNEEVLNDSEFINIYEHGRVYKEEAIKFVMQKERTAQQLKICILTMQDLALDSYLDFCDAVVEVFDRGGLPEYCLKTIIFPNFLKKHAIIKNYDNRRVIGLLNRIRNNKSISTGFRDNIANILSGRTLGDLK